MAISILATLVLSFVFIFSLHILFASIDKRELARSISANLKPRLSPGPDHYMMDNTPDHLLWFMQISDLHFSVHQDDGRVEGFANFCSESVLTIHPEFVSVSGDLTDARKKIFIMSEQSATEWGTYRNVIHKSGALNTTKFFDIPGNHDTFGVLTKTRNSGYFNKYAIRGQKNRGSYLYTIRKPFGTYSFIYVDASPLLGLNFPLNFFGGLSSSDGDRLRSFVRETKESNQTFWFGHYPSSTIISPGFDLRTVIGQSAFAYFCGHLHTLLHLAPRMYSLQPQGYLELELGDWKHERYYRVVAVDNDLVSFVDVQVRQHSRSVSSQWPVVLVTNPKDSNFLLPHKEPLDRIRKSTHIRMLVWSTHLIVQCSIFIDGHFQGNASRANHPVPLFFLLWNATHWADNRTHTLRVVVADSAGNQRVVSQPFVVDATPTWDFAPLASFVLQTDHTFNVRVIFYAFELFICGALVIPRIISPRLLCRFTRRSRLFRGLHRFVLCDCLCIPVLCYVVYLSFGPIFMGFLIEKHFGIVFSFGIFIAGSFVFESLTYFYELAQLGIIALIYLSYVFWILGKRHAKPVIVSHTQPASPSTSAPNFSQSMLDVHPPQTSCTICSIPTPLFYHALIFTILQSFFIIVTVGIPYGVVAAILSPGRLTCIPLSWYIASRISGALAKQNDPL